MPSVSQVQDPDSTFDVRLHLGVRGLDLGAALEWKMQCELFHTNYDLTEVKNRVNSANTSVKLFDPSRRNIRQMS